ncbi:MAG: lysine--tRNA ligase [Promethearchaeota archaeon]
MKRNRLFWADRIAQQVELRVQNETILQKIVEERGYICYDEKTPSGRIHVGSGRGWVIHDTVAKALRNRGLNARFILSSDDMDPMDSIPSDLEDPDYWNSFMGKPFRNIPSPEKGFKSFAEYYFHDATSKFAEYGIKAEIESTGERYVRGDFNTIIKLALDHTQRIQEIYNRFYESTTMRTKLPFNPICEKCGNIGTTRAYEWHPEDEKVDYHCKPDSVTWAQGCGYEGEISPYNGNGKFPWKVEWAAKWPTVGVVYETAGKDHFSAGGSRDISIAISREIFNFPPPLPSSAKKTEKGWIYKRGAGYEFFLIGGAKMASSKGQGFPFADMTYYAPGNILRYILVRTRPKSAINFDPQSDLERIYRDYDDTEKKFYETKANPTLLEKDKYFNAKRLYELSFIGNILPTQPTAVDFNFGVMIVQLTNSTEEAMSLLQNKGKLPTILTEEHQQIVVERLDFFRRWVNDLAPPDTIIMLTVNPQLQLTEKESRICKDFTNLLNSTENEQELIKGIKKITEQHRLETKEFYGLIYQVLFGSKSGPRLVPYVVFAGPNQIVQHIQKVISL